MSDLEKRAVDTEGEEGGGKKVKGGTSNMFMFKVRAFEDVLKLRGKHVPVLQPRSFNYLPDYNDQNQPGDHDKEKQKTGRTRKQPTTAEKPQRVEHSSEVHNDNLRRKYEEVRVLCQDQLTVLEQTKLLLERESERNRHLEQLVSEGKATSEQQLQEMEILNRTVKEKENQLNELREMLMENGAQCRAQTKKRLQLEQQIKDLKEESAAAESDIQLLKQNMQFYQNELQKMVGQDCQRNSDTQKRVEDLEQRNIQLQQEKQQQSWRICELEAELTSLQNSHGLELDLKHSEYEGEIRHLQEIAAQSISELRRELFRLQPNQQDEAGTMTDPISTSQYSTLTEVFDETERSKLEKTLQEENTIISHELELMKSVVERQKQIIQQRDEGWTQHTYNFEAYITAMKAELEGERQKLRTLQQVVSNSRSSILESLELSKHQSNRQKFLFDSVLQQNQTLKKKLSELKEQLRAVRGQ